MQRSFFLFFSTIPLEALFAFLVLILNLFDFLEKQNDRVSSDGLKFYAGITMHESHLIACSMNLSCDFIIDR
jgi:hypothetical protein